MPEPEGSSTGRSAVLLGATGLVGGQLLDLLLASPLYSRVRVLGRGRPPRRDPKLVFEEVDFDHLERHAELLRVDDVFCCLGTTMDKAGSQDAFRAVDFGYVVEAARLAADAGAEQFLVVSSVGADPDSRVFYNRVKGEMEAAVKRFPFRAVWIVRPSLLLGDRAEFRLGERFAQMVSRPLAWLLVGSLRRYRPVRARDVAGALLALAEEQGTGGLVESERIPEIAAGRG
jgi:uncharacterized protein YbjT (DUF2867 family)